MLHVKNYTTCYLISFNPSVLHCRKGCDFGMGRVNDEVLRKEAHEMCKRYTSELYITAEGELGSITR